MDKLSSLLARRFLGDDQHIEKVGKEKETKDKNNTKEQSIGNFALFKYTTKLERVAIGVGTFFGLLQAVTQAFFLQTYMNVVNSFVNYSISTTNFTVDSSFTEDFKSGILLDGVLVFIVVGLANVVAVFLSTWLWSFVADRNIRRIRSLVFRSIMRQEIGWFDKQSAGELTIRLSEDVYNIWLGTGDKIADILLLTSRSIGGVIMAFVSGWKLTLVFICFMPLVAISLMTMITIIKVFTQIEVKAYGQAGYVAEEVLSSIRTVHAFSRQLYEGQRYENNLHRARKIGILKALMLGLGQLCMNLSLYSSFSILIWYGPLLIRNEPNNYDPGKVMVVFFGVLISTFSLGTVAPNLQSLAEARASATKIFEMIERKSLIDVTRTDGIQEQIMGDIELNRVSFAYPARVDQQIFDEFSLTIKRGQTVALVGSSGCGKSTILQLLQRFYDPDRGKVLIDGHDLRSLNLNNYRRSVGIVSQEPVLFFGTIAENIELGNPGCSKDEIISAAKTANAHDFIMELPKAYDTVIGEGGASLSGGQKQRIAIARAIISQPRILLLDEATSALDTESEKIVQQALDKAIEDRTTVVVAHRLSTIKNADMIYVLDRGTIVEQGLHDDLIKKHGLYYELVTAQSTQRTGETDRRPIYPEKFILKETSSIDDFAESSDEEFDFDGALQPRVTFSETSEVKVKKSSMLHRLKKGTKKFFRRNLLDIRLMTEIMTFNINEIGYILGGIICSVMVAAILPVFSVIFTMLYEVFTMPPNQQSSTTRKLSLAIFGIGALGGLSTLGYSYFLGKSGEELTFRMRSRSFASMVAQDMSFFDQENNRVGALLTRLSLDASQLKGMTGQRLAVIIQSIAYLVIGGTLCFVYSWQIALAMLAMSPLVLIAGVVQGQKVVRTSKVKTSKKKKSKSESYEEEAGKVTSETLNNIRTVVSMRREDIFIDKYEFFYKKLYKQSIAINWKTAIGNGISQSVQFFVFGVAIGVGMQLLITGKVEFYNIFRVIALVNMVGSAVGRGSAFLVDFESAKKSASSILATIKQQPLIDSISDDGIKPHEAIKNNISAKDVSFCYPTRPFLEVLRKISFTAHDGVATAFVGPSGCGKSTIIALILRFYDAQAGELFLDKYNVKSLNIKWLRSRIGFVQQEPVLFDVTIRENILYGLPEGEGTTQMIQEAARLANIHTDITRLPLGYETKVGAKGTQLSGGQKQRIAIARALIRNPSILLLDEATSALDTTSEKVVQAALDEAQQSRTTISIAHRLATIKNCGHIIVINQGGIVEAGTQDELLRMNGLYAQLANAQSLA